MFTRRPYSPGCEERLKAVVAGFTRNLSLCRAGIYLIQLNGIEEAAMKAIKHEPFPLFVLFLHLLEDYLVYSGKSLPQSFLRHVLANPPDLCDSY